MNAIRIPIHSFVDLITNSSSELFISATDKTVDAVKGIIDALLATAGSKESAVDLFDIRLEYRVKAYVDSYIDETFASSAEREAFMIEKGIDAHGEYTGLIETLVVKARVINPHTKDVAKRLNALFGTLSTQEIQT